MTQPPLLGCLLVHKFPLWVLYRQRLYACCRGYPRLVPTSVASHQRRVTQPLLLGCLLVHRFLLWVLYRQHLKQGGGGSPAYSREHLSLLCPGPPTVLPLSMHAMEGSSLVFNGLPMYCSLLYRAIWTSDCYCLSSLLSSPLSQVCILSLVCNCR